MKLHTSLPASRVLSALMRARKAGHVTPDVVFAQFEEHTSRSHAHGYVIQLGAAAGGHLPEHYVNQYGKRQKCRRVRNSSVDMDHRFSATYHEWGWFMAEVFRMDPTAVFGAVKPKSWGYRGAVDFHLKTHYLFVR